LGRRGGGGVRHFEHYFLVDIFGQRFGKQQMHRPGMVSIWFFVGALVLIYGVLILGAGLYEQAVPPEHPVVLANLHAGIWWGALLIVLGAFYSFRFSPWRGR
jgi:hypothetical protein